MIGNKCTICNNVYFPPRDICPRCRRDSYGKMERYKLKTTGTVESYTIIRAPPPEFEGKSPYAIGLIKMDDNCYITAEIVDTALDDIRIGLRVESCFRIIQQEGTDGAIYYWYKFKKFSE
jgi:uncharacterized OB-fold protein